MKILKQTTSPLTIDDFRLYFQNKSNVLNYLTHKALDIPNETSEAYELELLRLKQLITNALSLISKELYNYSIGDYSAEIEKDQWKECIQLPEDGCYFLIPEKFTQQFIDSKAGKKFKNKPACPYMLMRALQSQKTILEHAIYRVYICNSKNHESSH